MPTVSVIIPSYNCEAYIAETVHSVLSQTYKDFELIVVDDGSSDRTAEIVADLDHSVRLIVQSNAGVCAARNRGIREARGKFVCLLDHDDYWFPTKLDRQLRAFEAYPEAGAVYSEFVVWQPDPDGQFLDPARFDLASYPDDADPKFSGWVYHQLLLDCWMLTSSAMFKAEVFEQCGVFDESLPYSEDWDLWLRMSRAVPIIKLRRPTTLYRQHPAQGNRLLRDVDYRTELLIKSSEKWGLCSKDGRCVEPRQFRSQLAEYHASYGLHHLRAGNSRQAFNALRKAWWTNPRKVRYLGYILAGSIGWRPNW
jgi:glycosyltransferase involved in cell wall biosynthesis